MPAIVTIIPAVVPFKPFLFDILGSALLADLHPEKNKDAVEYGHNNHSGPGSASTRGARIYCTDIPGNGLNENDTG